MKKILTILMVLLFSVFLNVSANGGQIQVPGKYSLGNQLEEVNKFWRTTIIDWEAVDKQSLVIETSPGNYYLLVLMVPSNELPFKMNRIRITNSGSLIRARLDSVIVSNGAHSRTRYPIERIYKIKGSKQMRAIISQLQGDKGETQAY
jgi:hypothetical protein